MRGWTRRWRQLSIALHHRSCPPLPNNCCGWSMFTTPWPAPPLAYLPCSPPMYTSHPSSGHWNGKFPGLRPRPTYTAVIRPGPTPGLPVRRQQISIPWQQTYLKAWSTMWVRGFEWWQSNSSFPSPTWVKSCESSPPGFIQPFMSRGSQQFRRVLWCLQMLLALLMEDSFIACTSGSQEFLIVCLNSTSNTQVHQGNWSHNSLSGLMAFVLSHKAVFFLSFQCISFQIIFQN